MLPLLLLLNLLNLLAGANTQETQPAAAASALITSPYSPMPTVVPRATSCHVGWENECGSTATCTPTQVCQKGRPCGGQCIATAAPTPAPSPSPAPVDSDCMVGWENQCSTGNTCLPAETCYRLRPCKGKCILDVPPVSMPSPIEPPPVSMPSPISPPPVSMPSPIPSSTPEPECHVGWENQCGGTGTCSPIETCYRLRPCAGKCVYGSGLSSIPPVSMPTPISPPPVSMPTPIPSPECHVGWENECGATATCTPIETCYRLRPCAGKCIATATPPPVSMPTPIEPPPVSMPTPMDPKACHVGWKSECEKSGTCTPTMTCFRGRPCGGVCIDGPTATAGPSACARR